MGLRRFGALYRGLPASARVHGPEHGGWTVTDHLLADVAEWTNAVYRMVLSTIPQDPKRPVIRKGPMPKPLVVERPGMKRAEATNRLSPRAFFRKMFGG